MNTEINTDLKNFNADDYDADIEEENFTKPSERSNGPSYQIVGPFKLKEGETPLSQVVGHEKQKKDILLILEWFKHYKELKQKGLSIPKGILLYGNSGNGKSLIIKEIIKCCETSVLIFHGRGYGYSEDIYKIFNKAKELGHTLIVFDEFDLVVENDRTALRALQDNLDSVSSDTDVLVLVACSSLDTIPSTLRRADRLGKGIFIPNPTGEEALILFKKYFKEFNLEFPEDYDIEEMALSMNGVSFSEIKGIVNDIILRNGFSKITSKMIDKSISNMTENVKEGARVINYATAIHKAGHAVMAYAFPQYFIVNKLKLSDSEDLYAIKEVEKDYWPFNKVIAHIKILLSGLLAENLFYKKGSLGAENDLQKAKEEASNLINSAGYINCKDTILKGISFCTNQKYRKNEKRIDALINKCEKEVRKYLKTHKKEIIKLSNLLFTKNNLNSSEIMSCFNKVVIPF